MVTRESSFQNHLIAVLERRFPGCVVIKNDASYRQGFPDLLVLIGESWFALEVKRAINSPLRPNQQYYVDMLDHMSFATFVHPENQKEVLNAMEQSLRLRGQTRSHLRQ